jgi:putative metallohydrolase (TIGR04338 family)
MKIERDSRMRKAYWAENRAFGWHNDRYPMIGFDRTERFCRRVLSNRWVVKAYQLPATLGTRIRIKARRGGTAEVWGSEEMQFGTSACREWIALHELAHVIHSYENHVGNVFRRHAGTEPVTEAAHGWRWAKVYLDLVRRFMGPGEAKKLRREFSARGVRHRTPRSDKGVSREMPAACMAALATKKGGQGHGIS